jgi:hypothetical protein
MKVSTAPIQTLEPGASASAINPAPVNRPKRIALIGKLSSQPVRAFSRNISLTKSAFGFCSLSHFRKASAFSKQLDKFLRCSLTFIDNFADAWCGDRDKIVNLSASNIAIELYAQTTPKNHIYYWFIPLASYECSILASGSSDVPARVGDRRQ